LLSHLCQRYRQVQARKQGVEAGTNDANPLYQTARSKVVSVNSITPAGGGD